VIISEQATKLIFSGDTQPCLSYYINIEKQRAKT